MAHSTFNRVTVIDACDRMLARIKELRKERYEREVLRLMERDLTPWFVIKWCKLWRIPHIPSFMTREQAEKRMNVNNEPFGWSNVDWINHEYSHQERDIRRIRNLANASNQNIVLTDEDVSTLGGSVNESN